MILALTWPKWLTLCVSFAAVWLLPENPPAEQNGWLNSLLNLLN